MTFPAPAGTPSAEERAAKIAGTIAIVFATGAADAALLSVKNSIASAIREAEYAAYSRAAELAAQFPDRTLLPPRPDSPPGSDGGWRYTTFDDIAAAIRALQTKPAPANVAET